MFQTVVTLRLKGNDWFHVFGDLFTGDGDEDEVEGETEPVASSQQQQQEQQQQQQQEQQELLETTRGERSHLIVWEVKY